MFERRPNLVACRDFIVVACLALLAGCGPGTVGVLPGVPANLTATGGNTVVTLTWTAGTNATAYNVKRSTTSGGPYTQVAAPSATSFKDSSLTNSTTYYYVVSAVSSVGESPNSVQASAIPGNFGTWIDVTPPGVDLTDMMPCGNFGAATVQANPAQASNLYVEFNCQGIWQSTDYGVTWSGPINTGINGAAVGDCSGGITISPFSKASVPTIYESCIRGTGIGFWKSLDGGVNWTNYAVGPNVRQDYYPPVVDPYDENHLLMTGHEFDSIVESIDGGLTWTNVSMNNGMLQNGGTGFIFFIDTGTASTARGTWLWLAQDNGGAFGTWRTTNSGGTWVQVDKNEHVNGAEQIYQPDKSGVVFMAGVSSALGQGVLRSTDYGQTWAHVGLNTNETIVTGTSKNLYAMYGLPLGPGGVSNPVFEVAPVPGTGTWIPPGTPVGLTQGSAQFSVVNNGTQNILVGAMWNSGVWRYVEP